MDVSEKMVGFPPKIIPFLIGCSIINHPFLGLPYFWKHPCNHIDIQNTQNLRRLSLDDLDVNRASGRTTQQLYPTTKSRKKGVVKISDQFASPVCFSSASSSYPVLNHGTVGGF